MHHSVSATILSQARKCAIDENAVGLDPITTNQISLLLHKLAEAYAPRIVLALRPQDMVPDWITHVVDIDQDGNVNSLGPKEVFLQNRRKSLKQYELSHSRIDGSREVAAQCQSDHITPGKPTSDKKALGRDHHSFIDRSTRVMNEPLVEMEGVRVAYGSKAVLGDWQQEVDGTLKCGLYWNVHRGQRWGIFGANGSGKTTLLSLVTSDHPQAYSQPVKLFQRSRLPSPGLKGITIFEVQARMGHASPEIHALFPKTLSLRRTLETAWSDTPITAPRLDEQASERVDAYLRLFEPELNAFARKDEAKQENLQWASRAIFRNLSFSAQRVLLFLRAIIRNPDIVILDEAFGGMDAPARDKCLLFLENGQNTNHDLDMAPREGDVVLPGLQEYQALLCVSHNEQEVPLCVREWLRLPEPGGSLRSGRLQGPLDKTSWDEIWHEG